MAGTPYQTCTPFLRPTAVCTNFAPPLSAVHAGVYDCVHDFVDAFVWGGAFITPGE